MLASQIRKHSQPPIQMETDSNYPSLQQVHEGRTQMPSSADHYQQMTLDSAVFEAIDKAWLDARES